MAAKNPDVYVYDAIGDFSLGVNSDLDPFIVPRNQMPFAVNATVRGNFVTDRPPFALQTFVFPTDDVTTVVEQGLFQGACYYRPDGGSEQLVAQISGRLFTFTPDANDTNVPVNEVTISGDPNPSGIPQAWLGQAERWVIVQNGSSTPIFYDGATSRRAAVNVTTNFAVTDTTPFNTPAIGQTVNAVMLADYDGALNEAIQLVEYDEFGGVSSTTIYEVVSVNGSATTYSLSLRSLGDTVGSGQGIYTQMLIQPGNLGNIITQALTYGIAGAIYKNIKLVTTMSSAIPSAAVVNSAVTINGDSGWKISKIENSRTKITYTHSDSAIIPIAPAYGDNVFLAGSSAPNTVVATLSASFVAPITGDVITPVAIRDAFTYPVNTIVFLNNKQYRVTAILAAVPVPDKNVLLRNINDSRLGHQFNNAALAPYNITKFYSFPELPAGRMFTYGQGRVWQSLPDGISFIAGDIVRGVAGSSSYNGRNAVLKVSENEYLAGGGAFSVPSNIGTITGMRFTSQLDASLGQGALMVVTPGGVFSCNAPPDRTQWQQLTNPILSESLIGLGGLGQNATIVVNGDLMFRSVDGIRSLIMARREFNSWGNTPISAEMNRVIDKDRPEGLPYASAAQFDNRMLMTCATVQGSQGVYSQGLIALNFDPISSLQGKTASVYDGLWTGLNVLQIIEGQFNGVHRCFAFAYSTTETKIQLYEIVKSGHLDNGTTPITWSFETPVMFKDAQNKGFFNFVQLEDGEFYVSDVLPGQKVYFKVEYRPDFATCWYPWREFSICNDSNSTTASYGTRLGLGKPPVENCNEVTEQTSNVGRWFQLRFTISGHCVFKGAKVAASIQPESKFAPVICDEET